jgi:hypothetical protein
MTFKAGIISVFALLTLVSGGESWAACIAAQPHQLLKQLTEKTPVSGKFSTRFVPVGAEAHLLIPAPPSASKETVLLYRVLVQTESEFWQGELSNNLAKKLHDISHGGSSDDLTGLADDVTVSSATLDNNKVDIGLLVPDNSHNLWKYRQFITFVCNKDDEVVFTATSEARVSNGAGSIVLAALATLFLVLVGTHGIRRIGADGSAPAGGKRLRARDRLNLLLMIAGPNGRASLAIFQIALFTFVVFYLLFLFLLRTGTLANLSTDVALLLGIATGGAIGGSIANQSLIGLSAGNDTWLRSKGWLPPREQPPNPRFRDLVTTGEQFDIYRFQTFAFNVVVAIALLVSGFTGLAEFTIPTGLLALLGLSQVAYVGGKAVTPKVADLDQALTKARETEESFKQAVTDKRSTGTTIADLNNAKASCPDEYKACKEAIGSAGDMFRAVLGDPIPPAKSEPDLPPPTMKHRALE